MTPVGIADVPNTAQRLWEAAEQAGWTVWATSATGTPIDAQGRPQHVTRRVPTGELTETGRPRVEVVTTDELVVVDSIAIRLARGEQRLAGLWIDGRFDIGLRFLPLGRLSARELIAIINEERS